MGLAIIIPDVDFGGFNLGKVTLNEDIPIEGLSIVSPESITSERYQLEVSFIPINTSHRDVIWRIISGSTYASITESGMLVIKQGANSNNVMVEAKSASNNEVLDSKQILLTYKQGVIPVIDGDTDTVLIGANLLSSGTYESRGGVSFISSILKRPVDSRSEININIDYYKLKGNDNQIKIGEYDIEGNWIARQYAYVANKSDTHKVFNLSETTAFITICIQSIGSTSDDLKLAYDSVTISGTKDDSIYGICNSENYEIY